MSQNYFNLFSGVSGSSGGSNWLSEWTSVKSGSYRKLLRSYYDKIDSANATSSGRKSRTSNALDQILEERKYPKVSQEVQEANASLGTGISSLTGAVSTLQKEDTYKDTEKGASAADKVVSAMKNYVNMYNDVITASKKSTMERQTANIAAVMKSSQANAGKLAEIGVTINRDGTLELNEGKLKAADVSKVQELFSKENAISYGSTVMSRLGFAAVYSSKVSSAEDETKEEDKTTYTGAAGLKADIEKLTSDSLFEKVKDKDGAERYDFDKILAAAKNFAGNYNSMIDAAKSSYNSGVVSNLAKIREKTAQNKDTLEKFGISVDDNGKLKIDEETFKKADMSEVQKFFKEYGSSIATNVSLVDYYMTTQADTANSYTANGIYNVQGGFRFDTIM